MKDTEYEISVVDCDDEEFPLIMLVDGDSPVWGELHKIYEAAVVYNNAKNKDFALGDFNRVYHKAAFDAACELVGYGFAINGYYIL